MTITRADVAAYLHSQHAQRRLVAVLDHFLYEASAAQKWRVVRPIERRLQRRISHAFVRQGALMLAQQAAGPAWLSVFDSVAAQTVTLFLDPIQDAAQAALVAGARRLIADLAVDTVFDLRNPRAVRYLEEHGVNLVRGINDTTRDRLRVVIRDAIDEGWSYSRIARAIRDQFDGFAGRKPQLHIQDRATLVAVTEAGMAYEAGNAIVVADLQDAGLVMEKSWLTVGDNRVSDGCRENQRAGWIPFDEPFPSGDMQPVRFPGCRCTALYRRKPG